MGCLGEIGGPRELLGDPEGGHVNVLRPRNVLRRSAQGHADWVAAALQDAAKRVRDLVPPRLRARPVSVVPTFDASPRPERYQNFQFF